MRRTRGGSTQRPRLNQSVWSGRLRGQLKPPELHRQQAKKRLRFHLLTVSSGRYRRRAEHPPDEAGDVAEKIIEAGGQTNQTRRLISEDARILETARREVIKSNSDSLVYVWG